MSSEFPNRLAVVIIGLSLELIPGGYRVYDNTGRPQAEVRESQDGSSFDVYKPNGERIGRGERNRFNPNVIDIYDKAGRRIQEIRPVPGGGKK